MPRAIFIYFLLPFIYLYCPIIYISVILYTALLFYRLLFYILLNTKLYAILYDILFIIYYILPSKDKDNDNNARFGLFWMPGSVHEKSVKNMIFTVKYCVLGGLCAFAARYKCV